MKTVKVFTYLDRQSSPFLSMWIDYYTKTIKADLCILRRNAHLGDLDIPSGIEVINIDHLIDPSMSNQWVVPPEVFEIYQKQFLQTHDIVMYCDVDEFIVHEDLDSIIRSSYHPCLVTTGVEIVEKYPTDFQFDFTKNVNDQRKYMVRSKWYDKPLIVNSPINWLPGKHNHGVFGNYVDGLYLVHLGRVCLDTYVKLHEDTRKIYSSSTYLEVFNREWYITHFNDADHPQQPMTEVPYGIRELINKIV